MIENPKQHLFNKLIDSMAIIRGNAQLASGIDHPRWSSRYIKQIIKEIDKALDLLKQVEIVYDSEIRNLPANKHNTGKY